MNCKKEKQYSENRKSISFMISAFMLLSCLLLFTGCSQRAFSQKRLQKHDAMYFDLFDTFSQITGYTETPEEFTRQADAFHEELLLYHRLYDIYSDDAGLNTLKTVNENAGIQPVEVDRRILDLLLFSRKMYEETDGAVNIALGSVLKLWHEKRTEANEHPELASLPDRRALEEALLHTDISKMIIDEEASTVYLADPEMSLDVGAVAKGFALQQTISMLPDGFLVSLGGNVGATPNRPENHGKWKIGIQDPDEPGKTLEALEIEHGSAVTSGDYMRYYVVNGKRYHHIIDPETLYPADSGIRSVTIICEDSGAADALSTACFIRGKEQSAELLEKFQAKAIWH